MYTNLKGFRIRSRVIKDDYQFRMIAEESLYQSSDEEACLLA